MDIGKYDVLIMKCTQNDWTIGDKSGTSYQLKFMDGGTVYNAKLTPTQYNEYKDVVQVEGQVELKMSAYNGVPRLEVVSLSVN